MNAEQVTACMALPGQRFRRADVHNHSDVQGTAAAELQAGFRRRIARRRVAALMLQRAAAEVLTRKGKVLAMQVTPACSSLPKSLPDNSRLTIHPNVHTC